MPECRLAVLGLSGKSHGRQEDGVGKSSLCFRFTHLSHKEYSEHGEDHASLVNLAEFEGAELNNDHYVYFGKARRDYLPSGSDNRLPLTVHVVEQTEFTDSNGLDSDAVCRQLSATPPYVDRATSDKLHSPGKVAYYSRSTIGLRQERPEPFPSEFESRGLDGYLFVLDPTSCAERRQKQIELLDKCLDRLARKPVAVVVTKCDLLPEDINTNMESGDFDLVQFFQAGSQRDKQASAASSERRGTLTRVAKHFRSIQTSFGKLEFKQKKLVVPYFCASARRDVGVDLPFLYLAHKALGLPGSAPKHIPYSRLLDKRTALKESLQSAVKKLLKEQVEHKAMTWAQKRQELSQNRQFHHYEDIFGEEKLKELFCARLIEIAISVRQEPAETTLSEESTPSPSRNRLPRVRRGRRKVSRDVEPRLSHISEPSEWAAKKDALEQLVENHPDLKALARNPKRFKRSIRKYCYLPVVESIQQEGHLPTVESIEQQGHLPTVESIEQQGTETGPAEVPTDQESHQQLLHGVHGVSKRTRVYPDAAVSATTTVKEEHSNDLDLEQIESSLSESNGSNSNTDVDEHHYVTIESIKGMKLMSVGEGSHVEEREMPPYQTLPDVPQPDTDVTESVARELPKTSVFESFTKEGCYTSFDPEEKGFPGSINQFQGEERSFSGLPILEDDSDLESPLTLAGLASPVSKFGPGDYSSQSHSTLSKALVQIHEGNQRRAKFEEKAKECVHANSASVDHCESDGHANDEIYTTIKECFHGYSSIRHRPRHRPRKKQPTVNVDSWSAEVIKPYSALSLVDSTACPGQGKIRSQLQLDLHLDEGRTSESSDDSCPYGEDTDPNGYICITHGDGDNAPCYIRRCTLETNESILPAEYITIIPPEENSGPKGNPQFVDEGAPGETHSSVQVNQTNQRLELDTEPPYAIHKLSPLIQCQSMSDRTAEDSKHICDHVHAPSVDANAAEPIYESLDPNSSKNISLPHTHGEMEPAEASQSKVCTDFTPALRESRQSSPCTKQRSSSSPIPLSRVKGTDESLKSVPSAGSPGSPRCSGSPGGSPRWHRKFGTHRKVRHSTSDDL